MAWGSLATSLLRFWFSLLWRTASASPHLSSFFTSFEKAEAIKEHFLVPPSPNTPIRRVTVLVLWSFTCCPYHNNKQPSARAPLNPYPAPPPPLRAVHSLPHVDNDLTRQFPLSSFPLSGDCSNTQQSSYLLKTRHLWPRLNFNRHPHSAPLYNTSTLLPGILLNPLPWGSPFCAHPSSMGNTHSSIHSVWTASCFLQEAPFSSWHWLLLLPHLILCLC